MTKPRRKAEIAAARQQGRDDRDAGLSVGRYRLHQSMDENHKRDGWMQRDAELAEEAKLDAEFVVEYAISNVEDEATVTALNALWDYVRERLQ